MIKQQEIDQATSDRAGQRASEQASPPARPGPPKSTIREFFEMAVSTAITALFLMTFVAQAVEVPTGSMQNNIHIGDHFFVNKFIFGRPTWLGGPLLPARDIRRGDVVVFKLPHDPKVNYIKRVTGLPGDEVWVRGRRVLVNGRELPEQQVSVQLVGPEYSALPELKVEPAPPGATYRVYYDQGHDTEPEYETPGAKYAVRSPVVVPPDSYFVMGDSRDNSLDSRFWGFVPRANIIGRALYVHWSFNPRDPERGSSGNRLLDFFTQTKWRRAGKAIK